MGFFDASHPGVAIAVDVDVKQELYQDMIHIQEPLAVELTKFSAFSEADEADGELLDPNNNEEMKKPENEGKKTHYCQVCEKSFSSKSGLDKHVKSIHEGRKFTCVECDETFSDKRNLRNHMKTVHTGERDYQCEQCSKTFSTKSILSDHLKVHRKPYSCHICGKCFSFKPHLDEHIVVHTGEKTHTCNVCGKCLHSV